MASYTLRPVARRPENRYVVRWRLSDGAVIEHPLTQAEYRALALKGASAPPNRTGEPDAIWLNATEHWQYDTRSGTLEPGDVTDAVPGFLVLAIPELKRGRVEIPRDRFTDETVTRLSLAAGIVPRLRIVDGVAEVD